MKNAFKEKDKLIVVTKDESWHLPWNSWLEWQGKNAFKQKDKLILMLEEDETEVQDDDYFHHIYMTSSLKQLIEVVRETFAFKEKDKVTEDES